MYKIIYSPKAIEDLQKLLRHQLRLLPHAGVRT